MTNMLELAVVELLRESKPEWATVFRHIGSGWYAVGIQSAEANWVGGLALTNWPGGEPGLSIIGYTGKSTKTWVPLADQDMVQQVWQFLSDLYELAKG